MIMLFYILTKHNWVKIEVVHENNINYRNSNSVFSHNTYLDLDLDLYFRVCQKLLFGKFQF